MRRHNEADGYIVLLAEPDYAGRIDYTVELARIGSLSRRSRSKIGRQLRSGARRLFVVRGWLPAGTLRASRGEWGTSHSADQIAPSGK